VSVSRGCIRDTKGEETGTDQEEIERNRREKVATKNDDAQIPEYLWAEHLISDYLWKNKDGSVRVWREEEVRNLPCVMQALQKVAFSFWKRKLRREFETYLGPKVRSMHKRFPMRLSQRKHYPQEEGMGNLLQSGRICRLFNSELESVRKYVGRDQWFYTWDVEGHTQYIRWFAARAMKGGVDLEAGADAVARGWRSTWWEWTDGSRPFHWRWPSWYRDRIRDGLEVFFKSSPRDGNANRRI